MNKILSFCIIAFALQSTHAQYIPKNTTPQQKNAALAWVESTYKNLSQDEKIGQLFIVALYTNKGEAHIEEVRNIVNKEKIGGLILMQDDPQRHISLVNEFQKSSKIPMLIGMDAEWGIYQRIAKAYKFPWSITLGAIQDKALIYEMAQKIAEDCKKIGVNWDFAPVVDVNTNPSNPIIGNRSFGSDVPNVISSGLAYANGLQDANILAAIKHFPGHGDTDTDSHLDLPLISHNQERLEKTELAPFKALMDKGIGGVMVAHLYVPALEKKKGIPASISYDIVTKLLKEKYQYKGLIITDALNMGAVANKYKPGELDALAFKAGNDIMLFSQGVAEGKKIIKNAISKGEISEKRLEESVKKILLTKYYLGLSTFEIINNDTIEADIHSPSHKALVQKLYSNAVTAVKDEANNLPLDCKEKYYYIPLEEAPYQAFVNEISLHTDVIIKKPSQLESIPANAKVIIGIHKDNSTAYKPYKISEASKKILNTIQQKHNVILTIFGSPYALRDMDIKNISTVIVAYENNEDSMVATAKALVGKTDIKGKLPVLVNDQLTFGMGKEIKGKQ